MSELDKSKEKRLRLIRQSMTFGLTTEDSLNYLKENKINISERTLRRDKEELKQQYGSKVIDIFHKEIASDIFKDFFTFQEIHNECWKIIRNEKTPVKEKIRLFNCLIKAINEKLTIRMKLPSHVSTANIIKTGDEALPFEIIVQKQSISFSDPWALEAIRKMSDKTREENVRKTDKTLTQVRN